MIMKGQKINDRYQIMKTIGEGGMANVYLAYDTILDRNVAVKVLRGDLATDEKFVRRFQREALSASSLSHPNIVEVYDVGEDNGSYYIVMEYIKGKHLKQLLKQRGKLTLTEVVDIMLQVTDGMSAAHDKYIIHRDIKPQNIMILENGLIKITDFGIAMALNSTQLTQTNSVMGSVHYLPPEQASGKGATIQSDVYSMGILMYELLTGELPFKGDNAVEIALKHIKEPFPKIRSILPNLPQSIENIIMKATAKNTKNRYNDAREMHDDLKTALTDERSAEPSYNFKYKELDDVKEKEKTEEKTEKKKKDDIDLSGFDDEEKPKKAPQKRPVKKEKGDVDIKTRKLTERDMRRRENKVLIVLGAIFTALVIVIVALAFIIPAVTAVKEVKVPDLTNLSESEAVEKLEKLKLSVAAENKYMNSSEVPEGKVVKTNPISGRRVKIGTEITLYISNGENSYTVEELTGKDANNVKYDLEKNYGLIVQIKKVDTDKSYQANEIMYTEPAAGEKLGEGGTITLFIKHIDDTYPDFTSGKYTLTQIEEWCNEYGVTLTTSYVPTSDYSVGTIYSQSKNVGSKVVAGQTLEIKIADEAANEEEGTDPDVDVG
ncbi:MAG: Stk1 family PASTA domain-containing Ser/Thr kinase [Bacilli bacterium]|nr:Stk1 family PASTA domain-containing Ser/Thr kinase [Bacilli bacterium]